MAKTLIRIFGIILCAIPILSFGVILNMATKGPLFTDEMPWFMQNSRFLLDGFVILNMYPGCESNFTLSVPPLMMPGLLIAGLTHPDSMWQARLYGVAKYVACILLLAGIIHKAFATKIRLVACLALACSVLSLGFLPSLFLIAGRPEVSILVGISLIVLCTLHGAPNESALKYKWLFVLCYATVLSWLFSQHPKTQSFFPAILLMAWVISKHWRMSWLERLSFVFITIAMMVSASQMWKPHQTCPDSINALNFLRSHTMLPADALNDPRGALNNILVNLGTAQDKFLVPIHVGFAYLGIYDYPSTLDVSAPLTHAANLALRIFIVLVCALLICSTLANLERRIRTEAIAACPRALPFLLLIAPLLTAATKNHIWSFWEAGYLTYLSILIIVLLCGQLHWPQRYPRSTNMVVAFIFATALMSHATLYGGWHGVYESAASKDQHPNGLFMHDHMQAIFDEEKRKERIRVAADLCNVPLTQESRHIVFDDWTYIGIYKTYRPFYGRYLFQNPLNNESFKDFLKRKKSAGIIMLCEKMPEEFRRISINHEGVCCLNGHNFDKKFSFPDPSDKQN